MSEERRNDFIPATLTVDEMTEALAQYYEAAGFADFYNRELKGKSEDTILQMYLRTFSDEGDE